MLKKQIMISFGNEIVLSVQCGSKLCFLRVGLTFKGDTLK